MIRILSTLLFAAAAFGQVKAIAIRQGKDALVSIAGTAGSSELNWILIVNESTERRETIGAHVLKSLAAETGMEPIVAELGDGILSDRKAASNWARLQRFLQSLKPFSTGGAVYAIVNGVPLVGQIAAGAAAVAPYIVGRPSYVEAAVPPEAWIRGGTPVVLPPGGWAGFLALTPWRGAKNWTKPKEVNVWSVAPAPVPAPVAGASMPARSPVEPWPQPAPIEHVPTYDPAQSRDRFHERLYLVLQQRRRR